MRSSDNSDKGVPFKSVSHHKDDVADLEVPDTKLRAIKKDSTRTAAHETKLSSDNVMRHSIASFGSRPCNHKGGSYVEFGIR